MKKKGEGFRREAANIWEVENLDSALAGVSEFRANIANLGANCSNCQLISILSVT